MTTSSRTYTVPEYGGLARATSVSGYQELPAAVFDALERFILTPSGATAADPIEFLSLSARRGVGKVITARNYVGVIALADGSVIEILPKIAGQDVTRDAAATRRTLLRMLATLRDPPFKSFALAHLDTARLPLMEVFIRLFVDEVATLAKQGLRSAYHRTESNERFFKGKLMVAPHLHHNLLRKERFYLAYDRFGLDRPENRLVKTTLALVARRSQDFANRRDARRLLGLFDEVGVAAHPDAEFARCGSDRGVSGYGRALAWCRVFLAHQSFTPLSGRHVALALLFPMATVFESYVAARLRQQAPPGVSVDTQDGGHHLFSTPEPAFAVRPDIVVRGDHTTVVMDTKWKLLSDRQANHGIAQADIYQVYAYAQKYQTRDVVLIYPRSEDVASPGLEYGADDGVRVRIAFVDLADGDADLAQLVASSLDPVGVP